MDMADLPLFSQSPGQHYSCVCRTCGLYVLTRVDLGVVMGFVIASPNISCFPTSSCVCVYAQKVVF